MTAVWPDGKRKIQLPSGLTPRNSARTEPLRGKRAIASDSLGVSEAMRPRFAIFDERCFVAEDTACVLPRSFEAVMLDSPAAFFSFVPDSLTASRDSTLASVFAICIGGFCSTTEPAACADNFSERASVGARLALAATTGVFVRSRTGFVKL